MTIQICIEVSDENKSTSEQVLDKVFADCDYNVSYHDDTCSIVDTDMIEVEKIGEEED
jgi:hypothetical protein